MRSYFLAPSANSVFTQGLYFDPSSLTSMLISFTAAAFVLCTSFCTAGETFERCWVTSRSYWSAIPPRRHPPHLVLRLRQVPVHARAELPQVSRDLRLELRDRPQAAVEGRVVPHQVVQHGHAEQ